MPKLKELIPGTFYDVFTSKHRETYFLYLKKLYEAIKEGRYNIKGLTKETCKEIISEFDADDFDEEEPDITEFENKYLNTLIKKGWLGIEYNSEIGENLITFPQYSSLFVEIIFKLDEEIGQLSEITIRQIHSLILTCCTLGPAGKGYEYLKDAVNNIHQYCIRLTSVRDMIKKEFEHVLEAGKESGNTISLDFFEEFITYDKRVRQSTNNVFGNHEFNRHVGEIKNLIILCNDKISKDRDDALTLKLEADTEDEAKTWQKELDQLRVTFDYVQEFNRELDNAVRLYEDTLEDIGNTAERARMKAQFINSSERKEAAVKLNKIIAYITSDSEANAEVYNVLAESLSLNGEQKILKASTIELTETKKPRKFEPVYVTLKENNDVYTQLDVHEKRRKKKLKLQAFEEKNMDGNIVRINKNSIQNEEDFRTLLMLWFEITEQYGNTVHNLQLSDSPVSVVDGNNSQLTFTEITYEKEGE